MEKVSLYLLDGRFTNRRVPYVGIEEIDLYDIGKAAEVFARDPEVKNEVIDLVIRVPKSVLMRKRETETEGRRIAAMA